MLRTSIATVCLSGTLTEKLHACAEAGFDGVELFEPDLLASPASPEEVGALARRLGLTLDLYQPFRDAEGVTEPEFAAVLHRARAKFRLMQRLGVDTVLVCSNVATATVDDDAVSADQLRRLGDEAQAHGVRIAYEALAWGRYVDDYRRAWRIAERADHPAVGVCLDSFHILSRGHDPAAIEQIPAEKIFFLQLADAPALTMDVLSWSRHHRLFPGEGSFDLAAFLGHVLDAGYTGPVSLEVFNDTFRQTDVERTARQAKRSLTWLEDQVARRPLRSRRADGPSRLPDVGQPVAFDFVEVKAEDAGEVDELLRLLGFTFRGHHRSKPVRLWTQGAARVLCNEHLARDWAPTLAAIGMEVPDPAASVRRAGLLGAPSVFRRTRAGEQDLVAFRAPEGTEIFFADPSAGEPAWVPEFDGGEQPGGAPRARDRPREPRAPVADLRGVRAVPHQRAGAALAGDPGGRRPDRPGPQPRDALGRRCGPARAQRRARAGPRDAPARRVPQPRRDRGRPARPRAGTASAARYRRTTTTTSPPGSTCPRRCSTRCASSACSTTGTTPVASSGTSTPARSARCSSSSSNVTAGTTGTARPAPRSASPPSTSRDGERWECHDRAVPGRHLRRDRRPAPA